jgi:hypothetical protein
MSDGLVLENNDSEPRNAHIIWNRLGAVLRMLKVTDTVLPTDRWKLSKIACSMKMSSWKD